MWFVLAICKKDGKLEEITLAECPFKDVAYKFAASLKEVECVIRYAEGIKSGYSKEALFFSELQEMKKGA